MSLRVTQLIADLASFNARLVLVDGKARVEIDDENPPPVELIKRVKEFKSLIVEHLQAEAEAAASSNVVNSDTGADHVVNRDSRPAPRIVTYINGKRTVIEAATVHDPSRNTKPAPGPETINPQRMMPCDMDDRQRERWHREQARLSDADLNEMSAMLAFGDRRLRGRTGWF